MNANDYPYTGAYESRRASLLASVTYALAYWNMYMLASVALFCLVYIVGHLCN